MTCRDAEPLLGVLVLGAIDPAERLPVEAHLSTCEHCTATLADLAVLPGLLHRLDLEEATRGLPAVPPEFTSRVLAAGAELSRERRARRRRLVWASVAAAVVLLVGGSVPVVLHRTAAPDTTVASGVPVVVSGTDTATAVSATVTLVPRTTGTSLELALSGVEPGEQCQLVAVDASGHREVASTWVASYRGSAVVSGSTALPQSSIEQLVVETLDGRTLVTVPVPHPSTA